MSRLILNRNGGSADEYGHLLAFNRSLSGDIIEGCQVQANGTPNMTVVVGQGSGRISTGTYPSSYGYFFGIDTTTGTPAGESVTITTANSSNPRIDTIVAYVDLSVTASTGSPNNPNNMLKLIAVAGTPAASPSAPTGSAIQSAIGGSNPYIVLANVLVGTSVTQINSGNITDLRSFVTPNAPSGLTGWTPAVETWAYASATTITVPTNATTKYDTGDLIMLTQNGTVKYFVINTVAATLLTVTGLFGASVTSGQTISQPYYSKARNPHASVNGAPVFNPYKFSAYRSAAWTAGTNAFAKITYDAVEYDTASNYSTSTGRFTAPVAGFYEFKARASSAFNNGTQQILSFYKNGSEFKRGPQNNLIWTNGASGLNNGTSHAAEIQLAAGDYVEVFYYGNAGAGEIGAGFTYFQGKLTSLT